MLPPIELFQPIDVPRELLWRALTTPEGLVGWQADAARWRGPGERVVELDWPALETRVQLEVEPVAVGRRVRYRSVDAVTDLEITARGVWLRHSGLELATEAAGLRASWTVSLALLSHALERHPGRARRVHWKLTRATCSAALLHEFLTRDGLQRRWLAREGARLETGSAYRLLLRSGARLAGSVLACVDAADVALVVREHGDAVLHLRSLPGPDGEQRLVAYCWSQWGADPPVELTGELDRALERLGVELDRQHAPRRPGEPLH